MIHVVDLAAASYTGMFDSLALAKDFVSKKATDGLHHEFIYLERMDAMRYISRVTYVDGVCVYNNKNFWTTQANAIELDYANHVVTDPFGVAIGKERFMIENCGNANRIVAVGDTPAEVDYNMTVGFEFVTLFREECILGDLGTQSAMGIAAATANLIPLVVTGSFREAQTVLFYMTPDSFLTAERLARYRAMLSAADIITYQS
jgi:hypothetical protein